MLKSQTPNLPWERCNTNVILLWEVIGCVGSRVRVDLVRLAKDGEVLASQMCSSHYSIGSAVAIIHSLFCFEIEAESKGESAGNENMRSIEFPEPICGRTNARINWVLTEIDIEI